MKTLILSDTHFGVKNNSMKWLKHQLAGLDEIIKYVKENDVEYIIHCGDLFESRSSISPYVVSKVNEKLTALCSSVKEMYIIGGNHDYYSQEHLPEYDITSLDFLWDLSNLLVFTQESACIPYKDGVIAYMPWFRFNVDELFKTDIKKIEKINPKIIFTHTDLQHPSENIYKDLARISCPIITGHVHTPNLKNKKRITVGSCFALTFADANEDRGFYTIEDWDVNTIEFHALESPIHFWRLYNDDVLNLNKDIQSHDKVEIYIDSNKYNLPEYREAIDEIKSICDATVIINTFEADANIKNIKDFDIEDIIEQSIPDHLKEKFNQIKCHMTSKN